MEQICPTPNTGIKTIEINESGNRYKCHIQTIKDFIQISLFINDNNKQEGRIHLSQIQNQIFTFMSYNINEIFEDINLLNERSFSVIKKEDKYILKIEFIILRKKQYLEIELISNINNNDLIQTITELKQIIQEKDNEINALKNDIKELNNELNNLKNGYKGLIKESGEISNEINNIKNKNSDNSLIMKESEKSFIFDEIEKKNK